HAEFLRVEGGDAKLIEAIKHKRWRELEGLSERQRALCAVAEKLSATPVRMVEDDWKPLRRLGFDDAAVLEVAHIVGIFNYLTRLADGFGLQLDEAVDNASRTGIALRRPR
ncbi:MAG: carboxymuconolactone decarboxylase family protein, partial [Candidatus Binataceae bacterium]